MPRHKRSRSRSRSPHTRSDRHSHRHRHRHKHSHSHSHGHRSRDKDKDEKNKHGIGIGIDSSKVISDDDYFSHNVEFRVWLTESKGLLFHDLTTDEAHHKFSKFVRAWNSGKLDKKYYNGELKYSDADAGTRTSYKWHFSGVDELEMDSIRDKVGSDSMKGKSTTSNEKDKEKEREQKQWQGHGHRSMGPTANPAHTITMEDDVDREERLARERVQMQHERRTYRKDNDAVLDELAPRPDPGGREARLEKRKLINQARRAREDSPEPAMNEADLMGSSSDFKTMLARKQDKDLKRKEEKKSQMAGKVEAYQAREDETMRQFRELVSQSGGIKIRKR